MEQKPPLDGKQEQIKVLLVDDEPGVLKLHSKALRGFTYKGNGLDIVEFNNAVAVINSLQTDDPEKPEIAVIVLDFELMPETGQPNGVDVIHHLRDTLANYVTQIILVTAQAGKVLDINPLVNQEKYEIDDYIDKNLGSIDRLPISVFNAIRLFESRKAEKKLMRSVVRQNKELSLLYRLLTDFFSDRSNQTFMEGDDIRKMTRFFLKRLAVFLNKPEKQIDQDAMDFLIAKKKIDFGNLFRMINVAIEDPLIGKLDLVYTRNWFERIENSMYWSGSDLQLARLYENLTSAELIERVDSDLFWLHFTGPYIPYIRLGWNKQVSDLLHLFYALERRKLFKNDFLKRMFKEISLHFQNTSHGSMRKMFHENVIRDEKVTAADSIAQYIWLNKNPCAATINELVDSL